jgi:hypothetical protein
MQARRSLEIDLRKAIVEGEFELLYQPIIDLGTQTISGFEALLRWQSPTRGLLLPGFHPPCGRNRPNRPTGELGAPARLHGRRGVAGLPDGRGQSLAPAIQ